jgi:hypothetical protein
MPENQAGDGVVIIESRKGTRCAVKCAIPGAPKCAFKGLSVTNVSASVRAYVEGKLLILQWLPPRDSNPDMLIQSQLSYH